MNISDIIAVVTLQTFYLGKHDLLTVYLGKLDFLRANAQKNRAKSTNRGHSSKPNLPSFSVCNRVLMSL